MITQRKRIVRIFIVVGVIFALMLTMHMLVNNLDLMGTLQAMHGG